MKQQNVDPAEIEKFQSIASRWWDPESEFKPLHDINPLRVDYIESRSGNLSAKKILDIGCGGGILAEAMALKGASVTGIDMAEMSLKVAKLHLHESELDIDYQLVTAEEFAQQNAGEFDIVTCLEMLEHVPDAASIVAAAASLLKPDGHLFFSTINRNPKAFVLAILGAEYILNMIPRGTHDYKKFIKPSELASAVRANQMEVIDITGMTYNPLTRHYRLDPDVDVNYLMHCSHQ
ncbi:MAG: bifunctional 2-polyprenyl-6-hydroxyphenol methylase/3-demethylubiquinol 3-O-methyltransferase UbiG [Gammaproteobacteria bacterium]|nr:MAG: bifunctional 2-polyprenyl-6-hydroxyphenol methylase/3-demethylubiquinol 3-O-methyltransferase UbiG [Gammaproteobacteria bacterium]